MSNEIGVAIDGPLARITIRRPPLNVLTTAMLREIARAFDAAASSSEVRAVRLDAEGKAFSAGVDVADHAGDAIEPMMDALVELFDAAERVPVPTVAVVHGAALGGGCEIALATDLCLAAERASFGQPEIRLGVFAPPASVLLPRLIGERRAMELLLTGETLPAAEAARIGLVNRVFADDAFETGVDEFIAGLLALSGEALRQAKRAVLAARGRPAGEAHRELRRLYLDELMRTHDAQEGIQSFMEKRRPLWKHR
jgi:cyclohexa-1,5-dienecarbonyl-CoA hydratase